jgi:hypothetical protein
MSGQVPVYEVVDLPTSGNSSSHKQGETKTEQFMLKQEQAKSIPHDSEYLTPTNDKLNQRAADQGQPLVADKENTYQPLIPARFSALGDDKNEYQSLTLKTSTVPPKFNVAPVGPAPPTIPPKPKAM